MKNIFVILFIGWGVSMIGYITINKANKYNNLNYFDVSDRIRKYKKSDEKININKK